MGGTARILAVLEPRSNTMKMGVCKDDLAPSLGRADEVFLLQPQHIPWQVAEVAEACVQPAHWSADVDTLAEMVVKTAHPGDHILVMSNGGFGGIHQMLLDKLAQKSGRGRISANASDHCPPCEGSFVFATRDCAMLTCERLRSTDSPPFRHAGRALRARLSVARAARKRRQTSGAEPPALRAGSVVR